MYNSSVPTMPPLVTVLMAVYNVAPYIRESINSILNQTFSDFEFLIYSDGSTDDTPAIIRSYTDARIIFIDNKQNRSVSPNLNEGLARARGRYIVRMDGDDIANPERIARQVAFMEANPAIGLCGSSVRYVGASNAVIKVPETNEIIQQTLWLQNAFFQPSVIIRTSVLRDNNLCYNTDYEFAEDYKLWSDMSTVTQLHNLPDVLLNYRIHPHQISRRRSDEQQKISLQIRSEQMRRWHIELTTQQQIDFRLFTDSNSWDSHTMADYQRLDQLLRDLRIITKQAGISPHIIDPLLAVQWTHVLSAVPNYSLALVPFVLRQPWCSYRPVRTTASLLAKCLLKWQPKVVQPAVA
jgi:glycosyltransferase involved in cell wall biosynthesis